jgi:hypothetical protein
MTAKKKNNLKSPVAYLAQGNSESIATGQKDGSTDYREIQANELAALRSIYMSDFEEVNLPAAAWSVCHRLLAMQDFSGLIRVPEISRSGFQNNLEGPVEFRHNDDTLHTASSYISKDISHSQN